MLKREEVILLIEGALRIFDIIDKVEYDDTEACIISHEHDELFVNIHKKICYKNQIDWTLLAEDLTDERVKNWKTERFSR